MIVDKEYKHEEDRKRFWCDVYVSLTSSDSCATSDQAKLWADEALVFFDEKFPIKKNTSPVIEHKTA